VYARYLAPALYGRQVTVRTSAEEIRSRTLKFCYQVLDRDTGQELVTGYTRHICIDREGKVARIPEEWRELLGGD
jgi:acyl-CoA thioester hydrolase